MSIVSTVYRLLYKVGFTPWEDMHKLPVAEQIGAMFEREEEGRQAPFGRALDVGCGSGIWSVALAQRGWDVTGVDIVPKALRRARERAAKAGVVVNLARADVTALPDANIGGEFDFVIDFNCVHDLAMPDRPLVGAGLTQVTRPGATLLMMAWTPARRMMGPRGASREEIESIYPAWQLIDESPVDVTDAPSEVRNAKPSWYRLRRG